MSQPEVTFKPGDLIEGFRVVAVTPVERLRALACRFEHEASGARLIHLFCDDEENAFSINFPTPPPDDTGMPHILEHMVLAGSDKHPVKEPFFEMIKMSMATFINAMTGYDTTYYPVSSNVHQDLFNLADVYFDAVFHPQLTAQTFAREAHHLAPADTAAPMGALRIDGIVYSEMKGVFSDPESVLGRDAVRLLLPDTCYGRESGGDPEAIRTLTHDKLLAFHAHHYHPSNALFVHYGNITPQRHLAFLAPLLAPFTRVPRTPEPSRQPRWSAPRLHCATYPVGDGEGTSDNTYLAMNWLTGDASDPVATARLTILSLLLLGHDAAPLHQALIDSHLGADLVMAGASSAGSEGTFHVGIKGSEADHLNAFRDLVLGTLRRIADTPFTTEQVETAFQQAAYESLEITSLFPLHTALRVVGAWMAGIDPLAYLDTAAHHKILRAEYAADPLLFNHLIRDCLLDNPHRLDIVLAPDPACQAQIDGQENAWLAARRAAMDDGTAREIAATAAELDKANGTPNSSEAVASLPQLRISDIPAEPLGIGTAITTLPGGAALLVNDLLTNGVVYLNLQFDLTGLPDHLWPFLPRYTEALNKFGAGDDDYAAIARRLGACTGGISAGVGFLSPIDDPERLLPALSISMKALDERITPALDLLEQLVFELNPGDRGRMRDVLTQVRAENRVAMIQNGDATVRLHAGRNLNTAAHLMQLTAGLPQLALSEGWVADFERGSREVAGAILEIRDFILNRGRLTASVTAPPRASEAVHQRLVEWHWRMSAKPISAGKVAFIPAPPAVEGLAASLQIAHSAMVMPAPHISHPDEPLLSVGAHLLTMDYMYPEIRFKGNAYGAGFRHNALNRCFVLNAFRDPRIAETIDVFRRVADFVRQAPWSQTDINRGIIGVAKRDQKPLRPAEATGVALYRHTVGETFERRAQRRRRQLEATPDSVRRALLEALEAGLPKASVCVMSSRSRLEAASAALGNLAIKDVQGDKDEALGIRN